MRLSITEALRKAIHDEMERDERVFCIGEDIGIPGGYGGAFTVTLGLEKDYRERVIDTPISEIAIFGLACGAAVMGMRPIADVQYGDFLLCAMDQVVNQIAKLLGEILHFRPPRTKLRRPAPARMTRRR